MKVPRFALFLTVCLVFAAPPLAVLLLRAFHVHVSDDAVRQLLEQYDETLFLLLGWIEPCLAPMLSKIEEFTGLDLTLHPHWKYVFQLMFVYFSANAKIAWSTGRKLIAAVLAISGALIALVVSASVGLLDPDASSFVSNLAIGAAPILGYAVYALIAAVMSGLLSRALHAADAGEPVQQFGEFVTSRAKRTAMTTVIGLIVLTVGVAVLSVAWPNVRNPGLPMLIVLVFLLGANWVARGLSQVRRKFAHAGGPKVSEIWDMANVRLGAGMMGTIVLAIVQVALLWVIGSLG